MSPFWGVVLVGCRDPIVTCRALGMYQKGEGEAGM